jgi:hypothetical protein
LERRDVDQTVLVIPGSFRLFSLERGKYYWTGENGCY